MGQFQENRIDESVIATSPAAAERRRARAQLSCKKSWRCFWNVFPLMSHAGIQPRCLLGNKQSGWVSPGSSFAYRKAAYRKQKAAGQVFLQGVCALQSQKISLEGRLQGLCNPSCCSKARPAILTLLQPLLSFPNTDANSELPNMSNFGETWLQPNLSTFPTSETPAVPTATLIASPHNIFPSFGLGITTAHGETLLPLCPYLLVALHHWHRQLFALLALCTCPGSKCWWFIAWTPTDSWILSCTDTARDRVFYFISNKSTKPPVQAHTSDTQTGAMWW